MPDINDFNQIKNVINALDNERPARLGYTQAAIDATGTAEVDALTGVFIDEDSSQINSIPTPDLIATDPLVQAIGLRTQAATVSRMMINHYFGRLGLNLLKLTEKVKLLVTDHLVNRYITPTGKVVESIAVSPQATVVNLVQNQSPLAANIPTTAQAIVAIPAAVSAGNAGVQTGADKKILDDLQAQAARLIDTAQTFLGSITFSKKITGSITGNADGNAATATKLLNARTIGGVSFDGSGNINLPGVNAAGNQSTSGNAATASKLATARNIGGVSFDGSADINLPGVNAAGNQNTSGNAATVTNGVYTSGNQTINGIKTFGSIPVGPASDPTSANELARKAYVDSKVGTPKTDSRIGMGLYTAKSTGIHSHLNLGRLTLENGVIEIGPSIVENASPLTITIGSNLTLGRWYIVYISNTGAVTVEVTSATNYDVFPEAQLNTAAPVNATGVARYKSGDATRRAIALAYSHPATDAWVSGTAYGYGTVINYSDGNNYVSLQAGNTGKTPTTEPTWWALMGHKDRVFRDKVFNLPEPTFGTGCLGDVELDGTGLGATATPFKGRDIGGEYHFNNLTINGTCFLGDNDNASASAVVIRVRGTLTIGASGLLNGNERGRGGEGGLSGVGTSNGAGGAGAKSGRPIFLYANRIVNNRPASEIWLTSRAGNPSNGNDSATSYLGSGGAGAHSSSAVTVVTNSSKVQGISKVLRGPGIASGPFRFVDAGGGGYGINVTTNLPGAGGSCANTPGVRLGEMGVGYTTTVPPANGGAFSFERGTGGSGGKNYPGFRSGCGGAGGGGLGGGGGGGRISTNASGGGTDGQNGGDVEYDCPMDQFVVIESYSSRRGI
jgi:hypothetical protein